MIHSDNQILLESVNEEVWRRRREEAYKRFLEDIEIGYVDADIKDLIFTVFTKKNIYTTSSCSGRISIVDSVYPWQRDEAYVIFKKHQPLLLSELLDVVNQKTLHRLWLIVSGPIIHFNALNLSSANKLLNIVRAAGFKHSGILSIGSGGIVVEVVSGIWVPFLLKDGDTIVVNDFKRIVDIANEMLKEGKQKLEKLFKFLKNVDI
ncbi:hypothetical protein QPL79_00475 [Ignisphaera sp. 4213-co]|uniref:tRNA(Phe) 7-((3-amino-3-carboxypropyl)-4-demethylwyosine(37)-N(4))-methyltransferase n=1 Tax=Ignisphaera cupida TaxID=3050454 RepID=A0ABD4Z4F4_9CREN|nr:hypothetical protein [Ignisphaera sp. 4213-co]MDK6027842.1 hypothetical protein [Ignisphaera sp. 4213-co]